MELTTGIVVFCILWFVILFTVLPWGVKTQDEQGDVTPGTVGSAPVNPNIWKKMVITTLITAAVFGIFYGVVEYDLIDFQAYFGRD